ncbi:MAG: transglutaminase domain-containing protein [bacterium]|nr:transglutaminase domain-containing protein [bacterium]
MFKKLLIFLSLVSFFMFHVAFVTAAEFKTDYQVEYFLSEQSQSLNSHVRFNIQVTNLRTDVYVNKFSISFPKTFIIHNIMGNDDSGPTIPKLINQPNSTQIEMEFTNPRIGRDTVNTFYLEFDQENLFKVNGNIWEVILPTIENKADSVYKVIVNLPNNTDKKISIAKPKPDFIINNSSGKQIIWNNPKTKTIYAVFGDSQTYSLDLTYNITNPKLIPVFTEIALPPDTLYQKTQIISLSAKPSETYQDEDGNLLARYYLNPKENKTIFYTGLVQIFPQPRQELLPSIQSDIIIQSQYLLSPQPVWNISASSLSSVDKTAKSVYDFTVNSLHYNFERVLKPNDRLGAQNALLNPNKAVCIEFSDLFVATAREKGIYAREIEGFGFSQDQTFRPLSLVSDVLHSWPEYYDTNAKLWIPVDPTWENTSGIDYFDSLDLNHIVFAIHGKKSEYPLPAGMYKFEKSRDVLVKNTNQIISSTTNIAIDSSGIPKTLTDNQTYKSKLIIANLGNTYIWNSNVSISSKHLNISPMAVSIKSLAPYQHIEIPIEIYVKDKNIKTNDSILIEFPGQDLISIKINIEPYIYALSMKIFFVTAFLFTLFVLFKLTFRHNRHK